jgi:hypothetical protein
MIKLTGECFKTRQTRQDKDEARQGNARLCLFEGDSKARNLLRQNKQSKARQAITTQGEALHQNIAKRDDTT